VVEEATVAENHIQEGDALHIHDVRGPGGIARTIVDQATVRGALAGSVCGNTVEGAFVKSAMVSGISLGGDRAMTAAVDAYTRCSTLPGALPWQRGPAMGLLAEWEAIRCKLLMHRLSGA